MSFSIEKNVRTDDGKAKPTFNFKRREMKYVVYNNEPVRDIISMIHSFFPVAPYKPDVFPTFIETTWCETPDWLVIKEYLERKSFRYKLRIRRYGNREGLTDNAFVEIKTKNILGKVSSKYRFMCPYSLIPDLFDGKDIRGEIEDINRNVPRFDILYNHTRRMISEEGFRPLLRARFPRAYFQRTREDALRLTLDGFVEFTYLPDNRRFKEGFRLLESKLRGEGDLDKLDEVLVAIGAHRLWRFSKYHRALKVFEPELLEKLRCML